MHIRYMVILIMNTIGNILLENNPSKLNELSDEEFLEKFRFLETEVNLEDGSSENMTLFRNKLILKLVRKHGLIQNIKNLKVIKNILESIPSTRPRIEEIISNNMSLYLFVISELLGILETYYKIIILEKVCNLFSQSELLDNPAITKLFSSDYFLDETNILNLFCAKDINQMTLEQENNALLYEIENKEDIFYQTKSNSKRNYHKSKSVKIIAEAVLTTEMADIIEQERHIAEQLVQILKQLPLENKNYKTFNTIVKDFLFENIQGDNKEEKIDELLILIIRIFKKILNKPLSQKQPISIDQKIKCIYYILLLVKKNAKNDLDNIGTEQEYSYFFIEFLNYYHKEVSKKTIATLINSQLLYIFNILFEILGNIGPESIQFENAQYFLVYTCTVFDELPGDLASTIIKMTTKRKEQTENNKNQLTLFNMN